MTYRSNPFDKKDYSNFAFKKSELLEILQAIDSSFSFDAPTRNNQESEPLSNFSSNSKPQYDYKFYLFKKPLLTFREAACIMTGYDPQYVDQCQNDTNFNQNFSDYLGAFEYLDSCIDAQLLPYDSYNNKLEAASFKQFLTNEKTFIDGFNDKDFANLSNENLAENTKLKNTIADLELDVVIEQGTVKKLNIEIEKLKGELLERDQKIKELEFSSQKDDMDLINLIFDDTATDRYAPDLVHAIQLWKALYIDNPLNSDSHSNRSNTWIGKNTPYKNEASIEVKRLREITSPFGSWNSERKKKIN
ncbi:hypothetical protein [Acinetobacter sp.]|uniref:hypothetical protein n=1 Tax=Acinetobacter sp. TaxID=472 RepID=UPI0035AE1F80